MSQIEEWTTKLAELAVFGANVQQGQLVAITSFVGKEELTRSVTRAAYERGAKYVDVLYFDQWVKRERIAHAAEDTLDYSPPWMSQRLLHLSDERAARITLSGPQAPRAFEGLDPARAGRDLLPYLPETGEVVNRMTTNWCIVPAPTLDWAEAVYPDLGSDDACKRLWEAVAHVCRLDMEDPSAAWIDRVANLKENADRLTGRRFDALRLHGPGTDLTIGLLPSSAWQAGDMTTIAGVRHLPKSSDEGSARLGEIALVDGEGRIGPLQTVFYDTLIDENAATHIALGTAYDHAVEDDADKKPEFARADSGRAKIPKARPLRDRGVLIRISV